MAKIAKSKYLSNNIGNRSRSIILLKLDRTGWSSTRIGRKYSLRKSKPKIDFESRPREAVSKLRKSQISKKVSPLWLTSSR